MECPGSISYTGREMLKHEIFKVFLGSEFFIYLYSSAVEIHKCNANVHAIINYTMQSHTVVVCMFQLHVQKNSRAIYVYSNLSGSAFKKNTTLPLSANFLKNKQLFR